MSRDPTKRPASTAAASARPAPKRTALPPDHQLDLHGMTVEQAEAAVERHLRRAHGAALPFVRIVHGHGTGALKLAVRELLDRHPLVSRHYPASQAEGGYGATVAELRRAGIRPVTKEEMARLSAPSPLKRR